jgi:tetratricopeptide (TPR) repeat protein
MSSIFLSYRRLDAAGHAGRLHDALTDHFGPDQVFQDYEDIEAGSDFVQVIETALGESSVLVLVIGDRWLTVALPDGRRRLDVPDDVVRLEVAAALGRGIPVIPVLVAGASMPAAGDLPSALAALPRHNALEISDSRWDYDVGRLLQRLEKVPGLRPVSLPTPVRLTWATRRQWIRQQMNPRGVFRAAFATLTVTATVLSVYWGLVPFLEGSPAPRPMTGDFNVAVADFGLQRDDRVEESEAGRELAQSFSDRLVGALAPLNTSGFDLQVRPPTEVDTLKGATPEERAREAEKQSRRIKADLIVYGTVEPDGSGSSFTPEFYLSAAKLVKAEELIGKHDLGAPVRTSEDFTRSVIARRDLRDRLLGRTGALANFVVGLSYYAGERLEEAAIHFESARTAPGLDDADGKEVLYLFLGNVAGKRNDLPTAEAHFARALELEPEYARAQIGAGSVLFQRSHRGCEPDDVDAPGLLRALELYRSAERARDQPPLADISTKAAFGQGQALLCLSNARVADHWAEARVAFERVIGEYGGRNERVRNTAAEAHAGLGLVALPSAAAPDARERYERALHEYDRAAEVTLLDERRAFFHSMRGFILSRLGEQRRALAAYDLAIRLEPDGARRNGYEEGRRAVAGGS